MVNPNGLLLGGRYEVRDLIGRGGMAEVHLGFDTRLSRTVAIKMLRFDLARDSVFQRRFRREAQAAASLNHPSIVAVYDTSEQDVPAADGNPVSVPYIVMERVHGSTVRELLTDGTPVPINEAVEIVAGVLSALEYSHQQGLVHRDIKPGNIMLTNDGKVKVMDFGIARAMTDSQATMTQTDAVVGTAQYLSPEQARGEQVDARSDLYSTGCLLFELLTGRPPFKGDSAVTVAYQHVSEAPARPSSIAPDIPEPLDRVVLKSLAKNRDDRYSTAAEMRLDLLSAAHGGAVHAPAVSSWAVPGTQVMPAAAAPAPPTQMMARSATETMAPGSPTQTSANKATSEAQKKKSKKPLWITLGVVLLLALGSLGLWAALKDSGEPTTAVVPGNLVGLSKAEARTALEKVGLEMVDGGTQPSDTVEAGKVTDSSPKPGETVPLKTKVTVFFSAGVPEVQVPDVSGMDQKQARDVLEKAELKVGDVTTEDSPTVEKNKVIRTDPNKGTMVSKGTTINLVLASGNVVIPSDLIGKDKATVVARLQKLGLSVTVTESEVADVNPGSVIEISPSGTVPARSTVEVIVAKKPPETTPPPPSTPTTSPTPD